MSTTHPNRPAGADHADALVRMQAALDEGRFFKLIGGGSLTEAERLGEVVRAYGLAGVDCIDIAPDPAVVEAVAQVLSELPEPKPALMVSLPLDPDLHFRKIELDEPGCIRCGLCLPACPTEALTLPDALAISQTLCYGCGRCVPTCPTDALSLLPFQVESHIRDVLSHPQVQAVEIHSRYVDPYMLEAFCIRWQALLQDKLISLCYRPEGIPFAQQRAFIETAGRFSRWPVMLQIDGAPMSGNDDPEAPRPALDAAVSVAKACQEASLPLPPLTISGGINAVTAQHLADPRYGFIAGVGMGTVARKAVWHLPPDAARAEALAMVSPFKCRQGLK